MMIIIKILAIIRHNRNFSAKIIRNIKFIKLQVQKNLITVFFAQQLLESIFSEESIFKRISLEALKQLNDAVFSSNSMRDLSQHMRLLSPTLNEFPA